MGRGPGQEHRTRSGSRKQQGSSAVGQAAWRGRRWGGILGRRQNRRLPGHALPCPARALGSGGAGPGGGRDARGGGGRCPRRGPCRGGGSGRGGAASRGGRAQPGWPRATRRRSSRSPEHVKERGRARRGGSERLREGNGAAAAGRAPAPAGPEFPAAARPGPAEGAGSGPGGRARSPAPCPPRCPACWPGWRCCCSAGPARPTPAAARPSTRSRPSATPT